MENASKALVMAAEVLIGIMIISLGVYLFATYSKTSKEIYDKQYEQQIIQFNTKYTNYIDKENLNIYDIRTIASYAKHDNESLSELDRNSEEQRVSVRFYGNSTDLADETDEAWDNRVKTDLNRIQGNNTELPKYECKICKDTGYITKNSQTEMCPCLKQKLFDMEYNKSNIYNLKNQNFENFALNLYSDDINPEKYKSKISPRENIILIKGICLSFIENFDDPNEKNLLFTGNTGLGKTFLSSCIANELIKKGKTILYQTAPVMLDTVIDYRFNKQNCSPDIYYNILNADLLIIDDLGTEAMNNIKFTELFNIINTRLLNQNKTTKTIISTNLSLQNLFSNYDERIVSRIVGNYNICYFFGDDIRFKKKKK